MNRLRYRLVRLVSEACNPHDPINRRISNLMIVLGSSRQLTADSQWLRTKRVRQTGWTLPAGVGAQTSAIRFAWNILSDDTKLPFLKSRCPTAVRAVRLWRRATRRHDSHPLRPMFNDWSCTNRVSRCIVRQQPAGAYVRRRYSCDEATSYAP